jgi:hypothetical protein
MNAATILERPALADFQLEPMEEARGLSFVPPHAVQGSPSRPQFTRSEAFIIELLSRGVTQDQIGAVMDLRDRQDAKEQEQAMTRAMAGFKSETIEIVKRKHVKFKTDKGVTEYDHAELHDVVEAITPHLSKYGLSVTWKPTKQTPEWVEVTCWVKHDLGGSDQATLGAAPDKTGGKNNIQAIGSTCSYLSRYLTLLLLGLAAKGQDNDGRGATPEGQATAGDTAQQQAISGPATWPDDKFEAQFARYSKAIEAGLKTHDEIVAMCTSKGALTVQQVARIRAVKAPTQAQA